MHDNSSSSIMKRGGNCRADATRCSCNEDDWLRHEGGRCLQKTDYTALSLARIRAAAAMPKLAVTVTTEP